MIKRLEQTYNHNKAKYLKGKKKSPAAPGVQSQTRMI